jgi:hypothetical protein
MKIVGAIKSFLPINAFEMQVYSDSSGQKYLHELSDGIIISFNKTGIDDAEIITDLVWKSTEMEFDIGDLAYHSYVISGKSVFLGSRQELSQSLIPLLRKKDFPDTAKLTIASFYKIYGVIKILVSKINTDSERQGSKLRVAEKNFMGNENIAAIKTVTEKDFLFYDSLIAKHHFLRWENFINLSAGELCFSGKKAKIEDFLVLVPGSYRREFETIITLYFETNPALVTNSFLKRNDAILGVLLYSQAHVSALAAQAVDYHSVEEYLSQKSESYKNEKPAVIDKQKLLQQAKETKEKMKPEPLEHKEYA